MNRINHQSDFTFILNLISPDGSPLGVPAFDFTLRLFTASAGNYFEARQVGGILIGAVNDSGRMRVILDSHRLFPGQLHARFSANIPDPLFPDGFRRIEVCQPLEITLVRDTTAIIDPALSETIVIPIETSDPSDPSDPSDSSDKSEGFTDDDINDILNEVLQDKQP